jgi:tetratricopeptide (TPR) repeat protein
VVQAAAIHGGVHYHPTKNPNFPPPRQLPAGVARFVNREPSLALLNGLLASVTERNSDPVVLAITGPPGVGKTALALHWAHQVRSHFPDGDLYVDMGGYGSRSPLSLEQAIDAFLRSLNVDPERIPVVIDERVALYRSILGDKKVLVVIDNVSSVRQVRNLLPGSHRCFAIVTSRSSLAGLVAREGATRVTLDVLTPEDAIRLLAEIIGDERIDADPESAARVAALCSYLPLALRVVAERVAGRPYLPLREVVRELLDEETRLDMLASREDELTDVRTAFSWSYRALAAESQRVFRLIGLHPGAEFSSTVAATLVNVPTATVRQQLQQLADAHLVQEIPGDRYRLHDLLRAYSIECGQREESQRERTHAIRRMMAWYLLSADAARRIILPHSHSIALMPPDGTPIPDLPDVTAAMDWYEQERLNLLSILRQAMDLGQYDIAWKLPVVADGFFELRSYWLEWVEIHEEGLRAARAVGDTAGVASNLFCLGDAHWRLGHHEQSIRYYESSVSMAADIEDRWLEGFSLRGLGLIFQEREQFEGSVPYFERALEVFRSSGVRRGEGMALLSLGISYRGLGRLEEAVRFGSEAVEIFRSIDDEWSTAWGLAPLADAHIEHGLFVTAQAQLTEALAIFQRFADLRSEAYVQYSLGRAFHGQGDAERALTHWSKALDMFERLDDSRAEEVRGLISSAGGEP